MLKEVLASSFLHGHKDITSLIKSGTGFGFWHLEFVGATTKIWRWKVSKIPKIEREIKIKRPKFWMRGIILASR
jgi:hypothetical protein